jgi:hypothetical protein
MTELTGEQVAEGRDALRGDAVSVAAALNLIALRGQSFLPFALALQERLQEALETNSALMAQAKALEERLQAAEAERDEARDPATLRREAFEEVDERVRLLPVPASSIGYRDAVMLVIRTLAEVER